MNTNPETEDPRLQTALEHLRSLLIDGETLEAWAAQKRMFALISRRMIVAATSGRFIALYRGLFGGFTMQDIRWQDLRDTRLKVGLFAAELTIKASSQSDLTIASTGPGAWAFRGLDKAQAQQIYRLAQTHEQAWREKRRVRELEEMRARAGGVQISTAPPLVPAGTVSQTGGDGIAKLQQAKQLLEAKLISDTEYESIKARVIGAL